jgi:hypothetical protein
MGTMNRVALLVLALWWGMMGALLALWWSMIQLKAPPAIPDNQRSIPDHQHSIPDHQRTIPDNQRTIPDNQMVACQPKIKINSGERPKASSSSEAGLAGREEARGLIEGELGREDACLFHGVRIYVFKFGVTRMSCIVRYGGSLEMTEAVGALSLFPAVCHRCKKYWSWLLSRSIMLKLDT